MEQSPTDKRPDRQRRQFLNYLNFSIDRTGERRAARAVAQLADMD